MLITHLGLNPPEAAVVYCVDEKSQVQGVNTKRDEEPEEKCWPIRAVLHWRWRGQPGWAGGPPRPPFGGWS
jgi:hypothetical protein